VGGHQSKNRHEIFRNSRIQSFSLKSWLIPSTKPTQCGPPPLTPSTSRSSRQASAVGERFNDIRRHISRQKDDTTGRKRRPQAGFPAFNGEDAYEPGELEESENKAGRGKRKRSQSPSYNRRFCAICETGPHQAKNCWYGSASSKVSKSWTAKTAIKLRADENLKNPAIKEQAERAAKEMEKEASY
jgi:hypothetical protein